MKRPLSLEMMLLLFLVLFVLLAIPVRGKELGDKLVVHEWGTFTSLQDETGRALGGINTNDEPVPDFVHRLAYNMLLSPTEAPPTFFQGAPSCHPDVTMRLETPVIYFYPPAGKEFPAFDVKVQFRGGWLTEFYPGADAKAPGIDADAPDHTFPDIKNGPVGQWLHFGGLKPEAVGELRWKGLRLNAPRDKGGPPQTDAKVWLAPREVEGIADVTTVNNETEKYLFYRGVGHVEASLTVSRNVHGELQVDTHGKPMPPAWLVEVLADGSLAFSAQDMTEQKLQPHTPWTLSGGEFTKGSFAKGNLARLRTSMHVELVRAGLFPDEADALLNTWSVSYFKAPGTRLFYLVPREVTDALLPLEISQPAEINRVMVGRIEIVTSAQRELLAHISQGPAPELWRMRGKTGDAESDFFKRPENVKLFDEVMAGTKPLHDLGLEVPDIYWDYLKLGRFRNALILDEQRQRPSAELAKFIEVNRFGAYEIPLEGGPPGPPSN